MDHDTSYSLTDLCELAEVTPRTVRYYIQQGLLPSAGSTGPGARYSEGHLDRLRLTRRLQRVHLPLSEIRSRLAALTDDEVRAALAQEPETPSGTAIDYVRTVLSKGAVPPRALPLRPMPSQAMPSLAMPSQTTLSRAMPSLATPSRATPSRAMPSHRPMMSDLSVPPPVEPAAPGDSHSMPGSVRDVTPLYAGPIPPDRSSWDRITLSPEIEVHVRRPLSRFQNRLLNRLLDFARKLIQEDQP